MGLSGLGLRAACHGLVMVIVATAATAGSPDAGVNLFFVKRSKNINEVHYDAVVDRDRCTWKEPYVDFYWRDLKEGDLVYNKIMFWEHRAYGLEVTPMSDTAIEIVLRPFKSAKIDRPITARLSKTETGCSISTTIAICDTVAEFQSAYIKVAGLLDLTYAYFDILGYKEGRRGSIIDQDLLSERFEKGEDGRCTYEVKSRPSPTRWQSGVVEKGLQMGRKSTLDGSNSDTALPGK